MTTNEELQIFCQNIKLLRQKNHLSQRKMARAMGICVQTLRTIESGTFPPRVSYQMLFYTSRFFHIPLDDLFSPISAE